MRKCTALVLAGSRGAPDALTIAAGVSHKALIPAGGQPMLARVVQTLLDCEHIGDILISIERPELALDLPLIAAQAASGRVRVIASAATPSQSVLAIIQDTDNIWPLLVTTGDHPLLSGEMIAYLLEHAAPAADAAAAIVEEAVIRAAYPQSLRTYMRFRGSAFSGANLFLLCNSNARGVVSFWRHIEANRKNPIRLMAALGVMSLLRFALGRLDLDQALQRLGRKCGARIGVVRLPYAQAAIDVDKPEDLALVTGILRSG